MRWIGRLSDRVGCRGVVGGKYEYFAIEWSLVWRLVQDRLPMLRPQVMKVIEAEFPDIGSRFEEGRR